MLSKSVMVYAVFTVLFYNQNLPQLYSNPNLPVELTPAAKQQPGMLAYVQYVAANPILSGIYKALSKPGGHLAAAAHDFHACDTGWPEFWQTDTVDNDPFSSICNDSVNDPEGSYLSIPVMVLEPLYHRGRECIALRFPQNAPLERLVRTVPYVRWSQTHRCWYLPMTPACYLDLKRIAGHAASLDETALREYGEKRKAVAATYLLPEQQLRAGTLVASPAWQLSLHNLNELQRFIQQIKLQAYSQSTLTTYRAEFLQLLKLLRSRNVDTLTADELRRYMVYCMEKEGISEQTAHSRINALKFYFEQVLGREKFFWEIPRPKKRFQLPKVLSERELERLFVAARTLKQKAILFTAYSAGLRVSEVVRLRISDIDSDRMQIFIAQAKGKKDRYVGLSILLLDVLRAYLRQSRPQPRNFLFEGPVPGTPFSTRSAQHIFNQAKRNAGIKKEVSFHVLRHSFATHLLEKGIDIKYIKDLLGHFQIRTTERYLHVKREDLIQLINPLDELYRTRPFRM